MRSSSCDSFSDIEDTGMPLAAWSMLSRVAFKTPLSPLEMCKASRSSADPAFSVPNQSPTMLWAWPNVLARTTARNTSFFIKQFQASIDIIDWHEGHSTFDNQVESPLWSLYAPACIAS